MGGSDTDRPLVGRVRFESASPYESTVGFCRALRTGNRILVSGTAPIAADGSTAFPGMAGGQTRRCIEIIRAAVEGLGGSLEDVVRTRVYLTAREHCDDVALVHGEVFGAVRPVSTFVVVAGLIDPDWVVEMEAEAILAEAPRSDLPTRECVFGTEDGPGFEIPACVRAELTTIEREWQRWGVPVITLAGCYNPRDVEGLELRSSDGRCLGLITWSRSGSEAELVTLEAMVRSQGLGTRMLAAAERELHALGVRRIALVTTNDNPRALGFYLRQGYRLVAVHANAMDRVRRQKPGVPVLGVDGNPLTDMWEMEKVLGQAGRVG